jgi:assimilatory nitrate reductase electron transfer subunit
MTERVVVVGAGMVGHRFVEELVRADRSGRFEIAMIGAEEYEPYNRILLSDVLAGRSDLKAIGLPRPDPRVRVARGVAAVRIDREGRAIELADGRRRLYDRLVLATGARAFVPPLPGLELEPRHVHVLRTLDDCRNIAARAINSRHAVVLGGGVLGLEAACGLRRRGVPVTVVDLDQHLMATQLDAPVAGVLAARLDDLGVEVVPAATVAEVVSADGELVAVRLTDGQVLPSDLMLVSCGVRAETGLAVAAGLEVDRGVVVDESLATSDPRIHAIGDCAEPPDGMTGLLAPGWRQAERLVAQLVGADSPVVEPVATPTAPTTEPVRLKAAGVDLVTMGVRGSAAQEADRVVTVSDPVGRRHVELVVREDALVGVTCLGAPDLSASLAVAYDRATPLPLDPLALLVADAPTEKSPSPVRMPGTTTVCRCNGVSKKEVVAAWEAGATDVAAVAAATRATTGCGSCRDVVCGLVDWLTASDPETPDALTAPRSTDVTRRNITAPSTS